jgi:hypothetical protein
MRVTSIVIVIVACVMVSRPALAADALPKVVDASPCKAPPTIDGELGPNEWRDARGLPFVMRMVGVNPAATEERDSELWVMNSANALYVALRVPDKEMNRSLSPLDIDFAMLAFCRGDRLAAGDDRKVIGPGLYVDKYAAGPDKDDADDPHADGRGAVTHRDGAYTFEWAVPLDPRDPNDLSARPGDTVRFNLVFFDQLRPALQGTKLGGAYGGELKRVDAWGALRLARDVKDDGGSAFRAPAWVTERFGRLANGPAGSLRMTEASLVPVEGGEAAKVLVSYTYRDPRGTEQEAFAKLYLPPRIHEDAKARVPLFHVAGYETDDGTALGYVRRGWVVASPRALTTNPLIRTINPETALLHAVRALSFVDDARVVIGGGSAGGYMTLMLAAETFPLAGAAPEVPPMNWGYNGAYFFKQKDTVAAPAKGQTNARIPALFAVGTMIDACKSVYGTDYDDDTWFAHSPIAHVSTITCPVIVYWSTADVLVPMNQIGARWVQTPGKGEFPEGFTMEPEKLMSSRAGRTRLMDVLAESDYEVFTVTVPQGTSRHSFLGAPARPALQEMPVSERKPWSITIVDEGPPVWNIDHRKFDLLFSRDVFLKRVMTGPVAPHQLTSAKLERLLDRYAGKEWLSSRLKHLDRPETEKADVMRGLLTYVEAGAANGRRFVELYGKLPAEKRVLSEADRDALMKRIGR